MAADRKIPPPPIYVRPTAGQAKVPGPGRSLPAPPPRPIAGARLAPPPLPPRPVRAPAPVHNPVQAKMQNPAAVRPFPGAGRASQDVAQPSWLRNVGLSTLGLGATGALLGLATGGVGAVAWYAAYGAVAGLVGGTVGDYALTSTTSSSTTRNSGSPFYDLVEPVPERRRKLLGTKRFVDLLFERFVRYGFRYNAKQYGSGALAGYYPGSDQAEKVAPENRQGSCEAYAATFAGVLKHFGIEAEADYAKAEKTDKLFVAKVDRFIDPEVRGNLFLDDKVLRGYYVFSGHTATWVKELGLFYDPMAVTTYTSFDRFVECELKAVKGNGLLFDICGSFRTLGYRNGQYQVRVTPDPEPPVPGNFSRYDLVRVKGD